MDAGTRDRGNAVRNGSAAALAWKSAAVMTVAFLVAGCSGLGDGASPPPVTLETPSKQVTPATVDSNHVAIDEQVELDVPEVGSGIAGTVYGGPACTMEEPPCLMPVHPIDAEVVVRDDGFLWFHGSEVARVKTNESGQFVMSLAPCRYVVTAVSADDDCQEREVEVTSEDFTHFEVECFI